MKSQGEFLKSQLAIRNSRMLFKHQEKAPIYVIERNLLSETMSDAWLIDHGQIQYVSMNACMHYNIISEQNPV